MQIELSQAELRQAGQRVVDFIANYLDSLENEPTVPAGISPRFLRDLLAEPVPRLPQGAQAALDDFIDKIAPNSARVGHPLYLGWTRTSPLGMAALSEALAAVLNQSVAVWEGAPSATEVELLVIEWIKEMSGYAPQAGGILTSGGSIANFVCLLAARSAADPDIREQGLSGKPPFTIYATTETHYCILKAAEMMGIGRRFVRIVPVDHEFRMQADRLEELIQSDRQAGLRPLAVTATLGTVTSGACDDLVSLSAVCKRQAVWLHVDGAYGGLAALTPEKKYLADGIQEADSLVFDPHKGLFVPFEAGCALVKNRSYLKAAFAVETDYLPNSEDDETIRIDDQAVEFHFRDYGPQLSRSFRALKIYITLKAYGVDRIAEALERQYNLASELADRLRTAEDFELMAPAPLGIVAFRYTGKRKSPETEIDFQDLDRLNMQMLREIQRGGKVFLSGARLRGNFCLRACMISHRTRLEDLDVILEEIRRVGTRLQEAAV
jgi:aromatic-L-amino-acid/L-tryptophan decarboxylase